MADEMTRPILIVEDDANFAALAGRYLAEAGFATIQACDGIAGLSLAREAEPSLVVLDIMLPGLGGIELCRELRKTSDVPVLMLTARAEETERIIGFTLGADDYVIKPFSPRELVERIKAILRRVEARPEAPDSPALVHGGLVLEPDKHRLTRNGDPVALTPSEFKLLHRLMRRPGRVFDRAQLLDCLYPNGEVVVDRVIDVHIGKLRQKIEPGPAHDRPDGARNRLPAGGERGSVRPFPGGLLWRLLAINVPIVVLVIVVMWLAIDYLAADYFSTLMKRYNISPAETHQMFLDAVHRYLVQASIAAVLLAVGLSAVFTTARCARW